MRTTILVILLIFCILKSIKIKVNIDDTYWVERDTGRKVYVRTIYPKVGVVFRFLDEDERSLTRCSLLTFIMNFKECDGPE